MVALVATQKHEEMVFFSLSILRSRSKDLVFVCPRFATKV